jgi:glycosyltransferase involved in cell wall biosynthesis
MNVNLARRNEFATLGQAQERAVTEGPELTVVIPTLNERDNIAPLVELLDAVLDTVSWEVIFVDDDSPDGTAERMCEISRRDRRVRCLQPIGRQGLTTACIEGALASSAPFIAVMDADMQHDERLLPQMLATLKSEPVDLVVGSRYVAGCGIGGLGYRPPACERLRHATLPYHLQSRDRRPNERFFYAAARGSGRHSSAPFRPGIQDSPRYPGVVAALPAVQGSALQISANASAARANSIRSSPGNT